MFSSFLDICSLVPLKYMPSFACYKNPWEGLINERCADMKYCKDEHINSTRQSWMSIQTASLLKSYIEGSIANSETMLK